MASRALSRTPACGTLPAGRTYLPRTLSDWEAAFVAGMKGDRIAYRQFLAAADMHLRRYFARRAPSADAEDLVQETLIAVHTKRATYNRDYPLMPWLNTIARYKWIDWLRRTRRAVQVELDENTADDKASAHPIAAHALTLLLKRLPARQAEVIRLVKLEGLSIAEASQASGQSESLVKVNIHRGLKKLMAFVDEGEGK